MKLITEIRELNSDFSITSIQEATDKKLYIEGPMAVGNALNRNGRMYDTDMLATKIGDYTTNFIDRNRAYGEFGHPSGPTVNGDRICIRVLSLRQDGDVFVGKAQVSSTPMGKIVEGILHDGGQLGVSTRGMGSLAPKNGVQMVQPDYYLAAIDVVTDPSGPNCYVNGVMENVEWVYDETHGWQTMELVETHKKTIKNGYRKMTESQKLKLFEQFISGL